MNEIMEREICDHYLILMIDDVNDELKNIIELCSVSFPINLGILKDHLANWISFRAYSRKKFKSMIIFLCLKIAILL